MARTEFPVREKLKRMKSLSAVERLVLDAIMDRKALPDDAESIAHICHISAIQAVVAVQLLTHKELIPKSPDA